MAGAAPRFRLIDFLVRWLFTFALLTAIYNPTGYSYVDWLLVPGSEYLPVKIFVGLTLALGVWFIYAMALRAMKSWGVLLGALFFGSAAWALENQGLLPRSLTFLFVLGQAGAAAWLAAGMSLVLVRQNVAGHVTAVDEVH
jgi:hypothetical protein